MVAPGEIVGDRYRIDALLAREASADVFRVHDMVAGRRAVLKVLRTGHVDARWFDREARMLARVEHPHVGRLIDAGRHGPVPYVVLELIDGTTLAERLERGPLAAPEARHVISDVASALAHIHARGLVHGDVTPSSILLVADGGARLADPGVARLVGGSRAADGGSTGGPPGQAQLGASEHVGARDIFALGLVLVAALSAPPAPADDPDATSVIGHVTPPEALPPTVPAAWRPLVRSMLDPDPAARPDAGAVLAKLAQESATGPEAPSAETQLLPADAVLRGERRGPDHRAEMSPDGGAHRAASGLMRQPVMWTLIVIATLAALAAIVMGRELSDGSSSDPRSDAGSPAAVEDGTATTTAPPSTMPDPTTTAPTVPPTSATTTGPPAPTCAEIDARKEWLDDQKQQLDVLYPDDKDLRDEVKGQIEDEKRALEDTRRALGC